MGARTFMQKFLTIGVLVIALLMSFGTASAQGIFDTTFFDSDFINAIRDGDNARVNAELLNASPNERSGDGVPAIIIAVDARNAEALQMLIDAGARVDTRDREDRTALTVAARMGQVGMVRTLLDAGADIERQGGHRETALLKASRQGHIEVVRVLLDAGAEVDTTDLTGRSALEYAEANRHRNVVALLREYGAH